ncbi:ribonuclease H-like domain-containing protein [Xylaria palmicola]|nr:ribonuclease H-like domain-containing protein [Xylaria palmicola]
MDPRGRGRGRGLERGRGRGIERGRGRGGPGTGPSRGGSGRGSANPPLWYSPPDGVVPAPNSEVAAIEGSVSDELSAGLSRLNFHESFPPRPSYGAKGSEITLWANYFGLKTPSDLVLFKYDLTIRPEATGMKLAHIIQLLLESPDLKDYRQELVTDFMSILIAKREIQKGDIVVRYRAEGEDEPHESAAQYTVRLGSPKTISVSDLIRSLTAKDWQIQDGEKPTAIQALNILLNHHAKSSSKIATIGSSKSFSLVNGETVNLDPTLVAIRGFFTSVRTATGRLLLNVNVCHSVLYKDGRLDILIRNFVAENSRDKLIEFLKRLRIKPTHLAERKNRSGQIIVRARTICGLATPGDGKQLAHPPRVSRLAAGPKDVQFWKEDDSPNRGRYISVYDYFQKTHKIPTIDQGLPVVNVGTLQRPSYLPAEVCDVLPGRPARVQLSLPQAQKMIRFAVRSPGDNATSITSRGLSNTGLSTNISSPLDKFGVKISSELITVQGRQLIPPRVIYKNSKEANINHGSWNMVPHGSNRLIFASSTHLRRWTCLYVDMPTSPSYVNTCMLKDPDHLRQLMKRIKGVLQETGVSADEPQPPRIVGLQRTDDPRLEEEIQRAARTLDMLFVILPGPAVPEYNRVKQLADVKYGIRTICCVGSKIERCQDQYLRNEALKVNLKLGGSNQSVCPDDLGLVAQGKTMVVGIDVTHPSPGSSSRAPSVSAVVASVDSKLGQWPGILKIQSKARQEMVSALEDMMKSRLALWRRKNAAYPENILIYRDGVSEGQYSQVLEEELPQLRAACKLYPNADRANGLPRITIVIVGKRHHTRFFTTKGSECHESSGNPKAGTVVDRGVTEARTWDFFLQSHAAIKGTARPAHYVVILDEIFCHRYARVATKNLADELQMITQSLCYVFGRANKAVSYCTPAYFADILCERARCYLHREYDGASPSAGSSSADTAGQAQTAFDKEVQVHERLKDTMFYI